MNTKLIIKRGKDLSDKELQTINYWRKKEFNSKSIINPQPGDDNWDKKYLILLSNEDKIVAFARS